MFNTVNELGLHVVGNPSNCLGLLFRPCSIRDNVRTVRRRGWSGLAVDGRYASQNNMIQHTAPALLVQILDAWTSDIAGCTAVDVF